MQVAAVEQLQQTLEMLRAQAAQAVAVMVALEVVALIPPLELLTRAAVAVVLLMLLLGQQVVAV
jgi:uncharacterized membrane protein YdjX (TVP38/TMEM64 family)